MRSGTFVGSAVAAGLILAATHGGASVLNPALLTAVPAAVPGNIALGRQMAAGYGWTGRQWDCLHSLWQRESAWDQFNTYPSHDTPPSVPGRAITTAYGIPQALPAQKMASAGLHWQTDPATQIRWGLGYIRSTYGDPCTALAFEETHQGY